MKRLILILIAAIAISTSAFAETIAEGYEKHPGATFFYCKERTWEGIPPMSAVERIAWKGCTVWIKFYDQDDELETTINDGVDYDEEVYIFPLSVCKIKINMIWEKLHYFGASGELLAVFDLDRHKTFESWRYKFESWRFN